MECGACRVGKVVEVVRLSWIRIWEGLCFLVGVVKRAAGSHTEVRKWGYEEMDD